jgi:D-alanyl-D-alanine carboxypeptidase
MKNKISLILLLFASFSLFGQKKAIEAYIKAHHFNGSILVSKNGKTVLKSNVGLADRSFDIENTDNTRYKIASMTKLFTAVLILKSYEKGMLNLNTPIKKYLPNYKGEGADKITIHHLLTHSSGMENCEKNGLEIYELPHTSDEILEKYCSGKLETPTGTQFGYNNGDYIVLGKIIEAIYKKTYKTVLQEQLLTPLNLKNTGLVEANTVYKNLASTYNYNDSTNVFEPSAPFYYENFFSAGAMYSTTTDLATFSNALFSGKLLNNTTLNLMLTPYPQFWNTAYSVWVTKQTINKNDYTVVERYGSIQGANTLLAHFLEQNITIILFSNTNATNLGELKNEIAKLIFEK